MATNITSLDKFDASLLEFGQVKTNEHGGKNIYFKYNGGRLYMKMPKLPIPFGVGTGKEDTSKFSIQFSVPKSHPQSKLIHQKADLLDDAVINAAYENQDLWWGDKKGKKSKDVITDKYHGFMKYASKGDYPPNIRCQLPTMNKDGAMVFTTEIYDENNNYMDEINTENYREYIPNQSQGSSLWTASSVWLSTQGFGISWKAVQIKVFKSESMLPRGQCLIDDDEEEEYEEETTDIHSDSKSDDEIVEDEEPVVTPAPVKKRVVKSK
jgi:hypothetical protein